MAEIGAVLIIGDKTEWDAKVLNQPSTEPNVVPGTLPSPNLTKSTLQLQQDIAEEKKHISESVKVMLPLLFISTRMTNLYSLSVCRFAS